MSSRSTLLAPPMAVEAHHLHRFPSQLLMDRVKDDCQEKVGIHDACFVIPAAFDGDGGFSGAPGIAGKKRMREITTGSYYDEAPFAHPHQNFLHDYLLIQQTQRRQAAEAAFLERRRLIEVQVEQIIENEVRKRLKAMDDEIEAAKKMNWDLEERIRCLNVENQIWRELAQTNQLTANLLRADLEQVISAQITDDQLQQCVGYDVEDDESCCGDNEDSGKVVAAPPSPARICRRCCRNEASVLLLPCCHLCLCAACGSTAASCPICNCFTNGTVNVNLT